jgi:hypothetical protein
MINLYRYAARSSEKQSYLKIKATDYPRNYLFAKSEESLVTELSGIQSGKFGTEK